MIFQMTLDSVLSGGKTQTSRLWKDSWATSFVSPNSDAIRAIYSCHDKQPFKRLRYEVGQVLSVQPARGQKGIAKIRILELAKRDVRNFDASDIAREGFPNKSWFFHTWTQMHDKKAHNGFSETDAVFNETFLISRPAEHYTALVINFELVQEGQS
jgi:hypothetical protein